jgi:hypothetical protein
MYRYSVDNAITYTPEDFVLFKESPFACWMERLTLENPEHGIPEDSDSRAPPAGPDRQDELAATLRGEGKGVALIDWDLDEPLRRAATLEAMRNGVDFIVNGQLALGPLSGTVNLLMRTSGYCEFGNFLYIPCDTQPKTTFASAFRLCFLADLLHSLQGQLPPQMLLIRGGADVVPLQTDDHSYHYRAVKKRFMDAQRNFRKHKMPDPAESSHFGRWADCANEVLKQRALGEASQVEREAERTAVAEEAVQEQEYLRPVAAVASSNSAYDMDDAMMPPPRRTVQGIGARGTLADQARELSSPAWETDSPAALRGVPDSGAMQPMDYIGSSSTAPHVGEAPPQPEARTRAPEPIAPVVEPALAEEVTAPAPVQEQPAAAPAVADHAEPPPVEISTADEVDEPVLQERGAELLREDLLPPFNGEVDTDELAVPAAGDLDTREAALEALEASEADEERWQPAPSPSLRAAVEREDILLRRDREFDQVPAEPVTDSLSGLGLDEWQPQPVQRNPGRRAADARIKRAQDSLLDRDEPAASAPAEKAPFSERLLDEIFNDSLITNENYATPFPEED